MEITDYKHDITLINDNQTDKDIIVLDDDDFIQTTFNLFSSNDSNNANPSSNHNLIDLTSCDTFDLTDIFLMNNQNNNLKIKNEIDFKNLNFNFNDQDDLDDSENDIELVSEKPKSHQMLVPSTNPFTSYRTNDSGSETSSIRMNKNEFKCEKCSKIFNKSYNYKRHLFLHQAKSHDAESDLDSTSSFSINQCPKCKKKILDKSNFAKHLKICHLKSGKKININQKVLQKKVNLAKKFQCEICSKIFNKKFNYHRHIRMHFLHEIMNHQHEPVSSFGTETAKLELYECDQCLRKFTTKLQLDNHKTKWHLTNYTCSQCENCCFSEKFDFIKHLNLVHSAKFKFECNYCRKSFRFISQYIQHRQSHLSKQTQLEDLNIEINDPTPIKCDLCGKKFSKKFNLKRHINTIHLNKAETDITISELS